MSTTSIAAGNNNKNTTILRLQSLLFLIFSFLLLLPLDNNNNNNGGGCFASSAAVENALRIEENAVVRSSGENIDKNSNVVVAEEENNSSLMKRGFKEIETAKTTEEMDEKTMPQQIEEGAAAAATTKDGGELEELTRTTSADFIATDFIETTATNAAVFAEEEEEEENVVDDGRNDKNNASCLNAVCPIVFPDCPSDSVPVLSTDFTSTSSNFPVPPPNNSAECCPPPIPLVQCRCDPQKCLVPTCPEGAESVVLVQRGTSDQPGQCCDQFQCRPFEADCQNVHCPEIFSSMLLDPYLPDGFACPEDSYRPQPYIPSGSCCPIVPQCQCRLGICEPARCSPGQHLLIEFRGRGEPGRCCDKYKCVESEVEIAPVGGGEGCRDGDRIFAKGERWHVEPCQKCECSAAGVALCRRMECPAISADCSWIELPPGECCPICLGCLDDQGKGYAPGEHWARDGCTNCTCGGDAVEEEGKNDDFHWECQKFICQTECERPRPPNVTRGECCPVCEDGPTIVLAPPPPNPCPILADCPLRCVLGMRQDRWTGCFECKCAAEEREDAMREENGDNKTISKAAKNQEEDDDDELAERKEFGKNCALLTPENCPRLCAHGYLLGTDGCALCQCAHCPPLIGNCEKQCVFGLDTNWMGCQICKCRETAAAVLDAENDAMPAASNFSYSAEEHQMATIHTRCFKKETTENASNRSSLNAHREAGEWWTENCRQCFCQSGKEFCSLIACPAREPDCPEEMWQRIGEECCPRCIISQNFLHSSDSKANKTFAVLNWQQQQQVCYSPGTGQLYVDGETWRLAAHGCLSCTCRIGHVLCVWNDGQPCPPTPCEHPTIDPDVDKCCPRCSAENASSIFDEPKNTNNNSSMRKTFENNDYTNNSITTFPKNDTTKSSSIFCREQTNLSVGEINNNKINKNSSSSIPLFYPPFSQWRRDECRSCRCTGEGKTECFRERCDDVGSEGRICRSGRWLSLKDRCCPICSDSLINSPHICLYNGHGYVAGEQFQDGPFRNCTCLSGGLLKCLEIHCPACPVEISASNAASKNFEATEVAAEEEEKEQKESITWKAAELSWCAAKCLWQQKQQQQQLEASEQQQQHSAGGVFSSFEQAKEQTVFLQAFGGDNDSNNFMATTTSTNFNNNNKIITSSNQQWPLFWLIVVWLAVCIPVLALLFSAFCSIAYLFAVLWTKYKWREAKAKFKSVSPNLSDAGGIEEGVGSKNKHQPPPPPNPIKWHLTTALLPDLAHQNKQQKSPPTPKKYTNVPIGTNGIQRRGEEPQKRFAEERNGGGDESSSLLRSVSFLGSGKNDEKEKISPTLRECVDDDEKIESVEEEFANV